MERLAARPIARAAVVRVSRQVLALTNAAPAGSVSVTTASSAEPGPNELTVMVKVTAPSAVVAGADLVIVTSGWPS